MAGGSALFDAFLSHSSADKPLVKEIGRWLQDETGLRVWLDEWNLIPGAPWQEGLEAALDDSRCCVVFLGASGIGGWQNEEMRVALDNRVAHGKLRVVPVLLPGAHRPDKESELPAFLRRLTWVRFGTDWKDETALHRLFCGIRGIPPGRRDGDAVEVCPYRGLEVFRREDRSFFFGRDALIERLLDHLGDHRFLAVVGPSGSGKSSLVQAGLVPELDDGETLIEILTPRERPLEELAVALRRCFPAGQAPPTEELLGRLRQSAEALHLIARELADAKGARRLVLVVDQFEELFTQTTDNEERRRFVANLLGAVERSGPTSVILTMRSDFLGRCVLDPDLNVFVEEHLFQVGPMNREELESAIIDPAHLVGLAFEDGLVDEILDDVEGSPGELPLLQHALLELYEGRDGARLTFKTYRLIGRIEGALSRRAEEEFSKLDDVEKETLRKMFVLCLVKVGEGTEDTRRRAVREELLAVGEDPRIAESVLAQWTDARLLTTQSDEARSYVLVDVAHEALIRKWGRLASWMGEGRELTRQLDDFRTRVRSWSKGYGDLLRARELRQVQEVVAQLGGSRSAEEKRFLGKSRTRMLLQRAGGLLILLLVVGSLISVVWQKLGAAREARAWASRVRWDMARELRERDRSLAFHMLAQAIDSTTSDVDREAMLLDLGGLLPQARTIFLDSYKDAGLPRTWLSADGLVAFEAERSDSNGWTLARHTVPELPGTAPERQELGRWLGDVVWTEGLEDWVAGYLLSFSDGAARTWRIADGSPVGGAMQVGDAVLGAAVRPDGKEAVFWWADGRVEVWSVQQKTKLRERRVTLSQEPPTSGLFDPSGASLLWSEKTTDGTSWRLIRTGDTADPKSADFRIGWGAIWARDLRFVLESNPPRLWDVASMLPIGEVQTSEGSRSYARSMGISPLDEVWIAEDGSTLIYTEHAEETRLLQWNSDSATSSLLRVGRFSEESPFGWQFFTHPERDLLMILSSPGEALVFQGGSLMGILQHSDECGSAQTFDGGFLGDGEAVIWDFNGGVSVWTLEPQPRLASCLPADGTQIKQIIKAPGNRLMTHAEDGRLRLRARGGGALVGEAVVAGNNVEISPSSTGRRVLLQGERLTVLEWSEHPGIAMPYRHELQEKDDDVLDVELSSDDEVLSWNQAGDVALWDSRTGREICRAPSRTALEGAVVRAGDGAFVRNLHGELQHWSIRPCELRRSWDLGRFETPPDRVFFPLLQVGADSKILAWGNRQVALVDALADELTVEPIRLDSTVSGARLIHQGTHALVQLADGRTEVWDLAGRRKTLSIEKFRADYPIGEGSFCPAGYCRGFSEKEGQSFVDVEGGRLVPLAKAQGINVYDWSVAEKERALIAAGSSRSTGQRLIGVWALDDGRLIAKTSLEDDQTDVTFSTQWSAAVIADWEKPQLVRVHTHGAEKVSRIPLGKRLRRVWSIADGDQFLLMFPRRVERRDAQTGDVLGEPIELTRDTSTVHVTVSPDEKRIVLCSGAAPYSIALYDLDQGQQIGRELAVSQCPRVHFFPDSSDRILVEETDVGSFARSAQAFDPHLGRRLGVRLEYGGFRSDIAVGSDLIVSYAASGEQMAWRPFGCRRMPPEGLVRSAVAITGYSLDEAANRLVQLPLDRLQQVRSELWSRGTEWDLRQTCWN